MQSQCETISTREIVIFPCLLLLPIFICQKILHVEYSPLILQRRVKHDDRQRDAW